LWFRIFLPFASEAASFWWVEISSMIDECSTLPIVTVYFNNS
jgi:hypothetical protein